MHNRRTMTTWCAAVVGGMILLGLTLPAQARVPGAPAPAPDASCSHPVKTFAPPAGTDFPFGITAGPAGTWFSHGGTIDRISGGSIHEYAVPDAASADIGWLVGNPESHWVWFSDRGNARLGRIDGAGTVKEYQLPDGDAGPSLAQGIVLGPGPNVWFTDYVNGRIGRLELNGGKLDFTDIPTAASGPVGLTRGADGDLYFVERSVAKIGRLDPRTGFFTEWTLAANAFPNRIVSAPNGDVYFTELNTNKVGRIDTTGHLREFDLAGGPVGLAQLDGRLFAPLSSTGQLAEISLSGKVLHAWSLPNAALVLQAAPSEGRMWVADDGADHVYRVRIDCSA